MAALPPRIGDLVIEDARLMFRNFAGHEKPFNSEGDRNFCVFLDAERATRMEKDGWNIRYLKQRDEDEGPPQAYVQVSVNYSKGRPPRVVLLTSRGRQDLGMDEVEILDYADIKTADVVLNPYPWEVNGKSGIKAYLKHLFATLDENALELKYAGIPDANPTSTETKSSSTASEED